MKKIILILLLLLVPVFVAYAIAPIVWALVGSVVVHGALLLFSWQDTMQMQQSFEMNTTAITDEELAAVGAPPLDGGPYCLYETSPIDSCAGTHQAHAENWWSVNGGNYPSGAYINSVTLTNQSQCGSTLYPCDYLQLEIYNQDGTFHSNYTTIALMPYGSATGECPTGMITDMSGNCQMENEDQAVDFYVDQRGDIHINLDPDNQTYLPDGMTVNGGDVTWETQSNYGFNQATLDFNTTDGEYLYVENNTDIPVTTVDGQMDYANVEHAIQVDENGNVTGEATILEYQSGNAPQVGDIVGDLVLTPGSTSGSSSNGTLFNYGSGTGTDPGGGTDPGTGTDPDPGTGSNCGGSGEPDCQVVVTNDISIDETGTPEFTGYGQQTTDLNSISTSDFGVKNFNVNTSSWFGISLGADSSCTDPQIYLGGQYATLPLCTYWLPWRGYIEYFLYIVTGVYCWRRSTRVLAGG